MTISDGIKMTKQNETKKKNQIVYTTIDGFIGQKGNSEMSIDKKKRERECT